MRQRIIDRLTYANVVSTLCLFVLLGGGAYAASVLPKNSVGSKQIKRKAVRGSDLAGDAVTSPNVKNGSLLGMDFAAGELPAPDTAQEVLGKLAQVDGPGSGLDADRLDGKDASDFQGSNPCPAGTIFHEAVCIETSKRSINASFATAQADCTDEGKRLPDVGELLTLRARITLGGSEYSSNVFRNSTNQDLVLSVADSGTPGTIQQASLIGYRCVSAPG